MGETPRAQRFPIHTALRYRENGHSDWHEGAIVNISHTGVLFKAERWVAPETRVQMSFKLPVDLINSGATVICEGQIARTVMAPKSDAWSAVAAQIRKYRFVRSKEDRGD